MVYDTNMEIQEISDYNAEISAGIMDSFELMFTDEMFAVNNAEFDNEGDIYSGTYSEE